jgi:NADH-ubiquinone oxidoreductase chain 5
VGDVLILISIAWALNTHWNIMFFWDSNFSIVLTVFITVAAITKRAQIPFSRWLPAAIAAPTPVSALVHSSTLVTAGIFLLFRFYPFLEHSFFFKKILLVLASLTALIAGLRAITECDMKKIIALSTLSQLRVIIISLAIGAPYIAFFHLITHALFKALLFLAAGRLIHLHSHSQDLRQIGNISSSSPIISTMLIVANTALCGAPFIAGFYSKDLILEFSLFSPTNFFFLSLFFLATGLTARYSTRFMLRVV